jgi:glycosyltransferase involved in cell wall biosynthesis
VREQLPKVHLHVVGDGPLRGALSRRAGDLGLDGAITFHGEIAHDVLPSFYRACDLFVLSSRFESQAMVALEAAACGCPVVATRVGVVPELGAAARGVAPGDAAALGEAMVNVLRDAGTRIAMAAAGPEVVRERFLVEHTLAGFKAIYDELVGVEARRG